MSIFNGKTKNFDKDEPGAQADRVRGIDVLGSFVAPTIYQNKANMKLAEYQYTKDLEMWDRQNAYNSPLEQMKRYEQAGLNPNLVVGGGSASSGNASTLPKYTAPHMQPIDLMGNMIGILSGFQDLKMKSAQTSDYEARASINQTKAEFERDVQSAKLYKLMKDGKISAAQFKELENTLFSIWGENLDDGVTLEHQFGRVSSDKVPEQWFEMMEAKRKAKLAELSETQISAQTEKLRKDMLEMTKNAFIFDKILNGLKVGSSFFSPIKIK